MSKLLELSGEFRGLAILNAARECVAAGERVTPATLQARLPEAKFPGLTDIGEDEAEAAFELIEQEADQHAASLEQPAEPAEVLASGIVHGISTEPQAEAPTLSRDEAIENLRQATVRLANARAAVIGATNKRSAARERLASAVTQWQTGLPKMTRDQAVRESITSYQATRAEQVRRSAVGPSVIDKVAQAQRGGPAAWGNFRRGASTVRGGLNFDPRKGPVAKLPSQR